MYCQLAHAICSKDHDPRNARLRQRTTRRMARDYDSQLLESVAVRRRRMRDALLFGAQRARRTADERLGKVFAGIAIAAVLCAGCVGWSFLQHTLAKQKAEQEKQQRQEQQYQQPPQTAKPQDPQKSAENSRNS
ncbi:conserved hypothetical protein [Streptomyces himastatinicus ATCC 53653]|uniref:Uncharacterized protein n=2 Tax=Streptomyces TaxID=1883 RepID=D9WBP3_9ACTN|nr:conserved hypothetical protein [Streptomyces himastatinicus ATCC 53653]